MKVNLLFFVILLFQFNLIGQNSIGAGGRLKFSVFDYHYGNSTIQTDLKYNQPVTEIVGTNSFYQNKTSSKFEIGYTFEVGLELSRYSETNIRIPIEPQWNSDTIGYRTGAKFKSRKIQFSNYIDLRYKITKKITLINSLGFKLENRGGNKVIKGSYYSAYITIKDNHTDANSDERLDINVEYYENRFPLNFKFTFIPQLQLEFDQFFFKIQFYQDLLNINKYLKPLNIGGINYRNFSGIGIIVSPNSTLNKRHHYIIQH